MEISKMGETDGGIVPRRPSLAHSLITRIRLHVEPKIKRARTLMASAADSGLKLVISQVVLILIGVILGMLGFWLKDQKEDIEYATNVALNNASRVTALENRQVVIDEINRRLGVIENELRGRP